MSGPIGAVFMLLCVDTLVVSVVHVNNLNELQKFSINECNHVMNMTMQETATAWLSINCVHNIRLLCFCMSVYCSWTVKAHFEITV